MEVNSLAESINQGLKVGLKDHSAMQYLKLGESKQLISGDEVEVDCYWLCRQCGEIIFVSEVHIPQNLIAEMRISDPVDDVILERMKRDLDPWADSYLFATVKAHKCYGTDK